ncbi:MAG: hypothetical protein KKB39_04070 [Nanoarchaeota archaeon]|nr:hypothetical protein [Nanoarchaeota archaeon]
MKKDYIILFAIFIVVFQFRLLFAFQTPYLSADDAYYNLRHTEHIMQTFSPIIFDQLSYGGRYIIDSHLFHYFLAFLKLILPMSFVFKMLPELLFASLVFIIYGIAKRITENSTAALFAAFISGFIPIFISNSLNNLSQYALLFPLLFYQLYCMLNLKTHMGRFILLAFILPLLHPFSFILSIAMVLYSILLNLEGMKVVKMQRESILFYILIGILINLILYKRAFFSSGLLAVWQSIPTNLLVQYFTNINVLALVYNIGFIPLILGILGILIGLFKEKQKPVYLLSAMILGNFILLFLKLISIQVGMMFLGILLALISALSIEKLISYLNMTKFVKYKQHLFFLGVILIVLTMVIPSYFNAKNIIDNSISFQEVEALNWIKDNTHENSTVLASIEEGNYITSIAKRKNVADKQFMLAPNRYSEMQEMFITESQVKALQFIDKYGVDFIYLSERTKKERSIEHLKYVDKKCFHMVFKNEKTTIYKVLC